MVRIGRWDDPMTTTISSRPRGAFTRIELLVILLTLGLLAVVARPVWGTSEHASRQTVCIDNLRRITAAWLVYADDHQGAMPLNNGGAESQAPPLGRASWISGWLDWTTGAANTNTAYLVDSRYASLAPYTGRDASLYKCPADVFQSNAQAASGRPGRVRSYSMNAFMGSGSGKDFNSGYLTYTKNSDLRTLAPAQAFVLLEEHPDSINDPVFIQSMSQPMWFDLPASFHDGSCGFSFADGHVEIHRWASAKTSVPVRFYFVSPTIPPNDPDYLWLKARSGERP